MGCIIPHHLPSNLRPQTYTVKDSICEKPCYDSDDGGKTWQRMSEEAGLRHRAWYYQYIIADPQDCETLWVLNVQAWKSIDGGKTFFNVATPHADNHDLWIDPHPTGCATSYTHQMEGLQFFAYRIWVSAMMCHSTVSSASGQ